MKFVVLNQVKLDQVYLQFQWNTVKDSDFKN